MAMLWRHKQGQSTTHAVETLEIPEEYLPAVAEALEAALEETGKDTAPAGEDAE